MTTGQRIKAARKNAKMTQKELGQKLGISSQSIAQWENDLRNPKIETLQRIADALDVSVDYLLGTYHLKGILDYRIFEIQERIFKDMKREGLSGEEFCAKLGLPIDEWFKWKEASSTSYLDHLPEISKLLGVSADVLTGKKADTTPPSRIRLLSAFNNLNDAGQQKAVERVSELTEVPKYRRSAASCGTSDTDTAPTVETPQNGSEASTEGKK